MKFNALLLSLSILLSTYAFAQSEQPLDTPPESENPDNTEMTQAKMANIIKQLVETTEGPDNNLNFVFNGVSIAMVSDSGANRMRLVSPVTEAEKLTDEQIRLSLVSNFHLALDARYAIGSGVLFSTYIHPLAELTEEQLISAVRQVATLNNTFGTSYTSGELSFGAQAQEQEEERVDI